jgi:hypothetical protein
MDNSLRSLERTYRLEQTADSLSALNRARTRAGLPEIDPHPLLTYAYEVQEEFDEIWWHRRGPWPFIFGNRYMDKDYDKHAKKLVKPHKMRNSFRRGKNSKRKTLRTHRTGT